MPSTKFAGEKGWYIMSGIRETNKRYAPQSFLD